MTATIQEHLAALYGRDQATKVLPLLNELLERYPGYDCLPDRSNLPLNQRDALLITYGDQVRKRGEDPLRTLGSFMQKHLRGIINGVHLLPFHPYTSDDGFAVLDFHEVNPALGSWEDIHQIGRRFNLMVDAVFNHMSAQSEWFRRFLEGDPEYEDFFIAVRGNPNLSKVFRPRALPLLTPFKTLDGKRKLIWTTFSGDQVDLNVKSPRVLLALIEVMLSSVRHGAEYIRLDSVAYLWKQTGTPCIHLPRTHRLVQLLRAILDEVAPDVMLVTQTNVPHQENISYFGDGANEAQLVYNYALPPLVLHALARGDASRLTKWARSLRLPSRQVTFFNFLGSHEGIGVNAARGILSEREIQWLVRRTQDHGGYIGYRQLPDGRKGPYELNINFFDALSDPDSKREPVRLKVDRFLAAQAIMLAIIGVPGIYFHSLFGSRGDLIGVQTSGIPRRINRQRLPLGDLERELRNKASQRARVFAGFKRLLGARRNSRAFHPGGEQQVLAGDKHVFGLLRISPAGRERVICLHNVTSRKVNHRLSRPWTKAGAKFTDLISGRARQMPAGGELVLELRPYEVWWARVEEAKR